MQIFRTSVALGAASMLALTACSDPSQYPGTPGNRTREGAMAGAALGGVLGAINGKGSRADDIVAGAVLGGVAGGIAGNVMDQQARELRQGFNDDRISVINMGDHLVVRMPEAILFATDSFDLRPGLRQDLYVLSDNLNKYPNSIVTVTGNTDNTGTASYNQGLSERRAWAVADVLRSGGVAGSRMNVVGAGESQPIATNTTAAGRQQNRRVEITITPTR